MPEKIEIRFIKPKRKSISGFFRGIFGLTKSNVFSSILLGLIVAGLFSATFYAFATPPSSAYAPGETTNPTCAPGDTNCTVTASVPYTGATAAVNLGSNTLTTTGSASFGSLTLTTTALTVANGGTGNSSLTAYALLAGGTTSTGNLQQVSGVGTSGQVLTSAGAGALPTWTTLSTGTVTSVSGTTNRITVATGTTTPVIDISASYVGQSSITTLGTITTGTWNGSLITGTYGGTGVNNGTKTLTYLKNISFTSADDTGVYTLPTGTKTLVATDVATLSSLASIGTITTGTWNGSVIGGTYGGTGVNNGSSTITLGNNFTTSGNFALTLTQTGTTNVTLPTSGTLVNTAVTTLSSLASIGTITSGTWNGSLITGTYGGTGVNNGTKTLTYLKNISFTSADDTGVYTLPTGTKTLVATDVATLSSLASIGTITTGVWNGTIITSAYGGTGNGFTKFTGPTTSEKTFTLPNASSTILTSNDVVTVAQGGTNATSASITAFNNITGYTAAGSTGTTSTNLVFSTSPVLTTPNIGAATGTSVTLTNTGGAQATLKYDASNSTAQTTASNGDFTLATTSGSSAGNINLNSAISGDSTILGTSGTLVLGGSGGTNNENLKLDFETNANKVGITSSTGVTDIDLGSINLITTGSLTMGGSTTATLVTRVKAGAATESDANGSLVVDSSNGRIYFRYGGAWHYAAQTAGFQIPADEVIDPISGDQMQLGDLVVGMVSKTDDGRDKFDDGALHARFVKFSTVKEALIHEIKTGEDTLTPESLISDSTNVSGVTQTTLLGKVTNSLFSLGISMKNGITNITNLATEKFSTKTARIEKLEMVDSGTGDVYCTWISEGQWQKAKGECGSLQVTSATPASSLPQDPQQIANQVTKDLKPVIQSQVESQVQQQVQTEVQNQLQSQQNTSSPQSTQDQIPPDDSSTQTPDPQQQTPTSFDQPVAPDGPSAFMNNVGKILAFVVSRIIPDAIRNSVAGLLQGTGNLLTDKVGSIKELVSFVGRK